MQRLSALQRNLLAAVAHLSRLEGAVGARNLAGQLLQSDAIERQALRVGRDADFLRLIAGNVGEADVVEFRQFDLQLTRHAADTVGGPVGGGLKLRRQGEDDDGDVVDAASDDQRFGDSTRNAIDIGSDLLMHAQDRGIRTGADEKARGDHDLVVARLRIDVLDAVDALDDGFERFGDELHGIFGPEPIGLHHDVDHGNRNLRLFLARQGDQCHEPDGQCRQQEQWRQRRLDEGTREASGYSESHGWTTLSPGARPDRISTDLCPFSSKLAPMITGTSTSPVAEATRT